MVKATAGWNIFHVISAYGNQKWIITAFKLIIFYCLKTFCDIKFFKYLPLGMFSSRLYSSFLLIKPRAAKYQLSISFLWGTCTLCFFFIFKAGEYFSSLFSFLTGFVISSTLFRFSKVLEYQVSSPEVLM